jgi:cullin 3
MLVDNFNTSFSFLFSIDPVFFPSNRHLSRRLLGGKSNSEEAERAMISKLKTECGYHFTSKLEGMFTDMAMSKETMEAYTFRNKEEDAEEEGEDEEVEKNKKKSSLLTHGAEVIQLDVKVLTAAHWPATNIPQCTLPAEVMRCFNSFESFYLRKHTVNTCSPFRDFNTLLLFFFLLFLCNT